MPKRRQNGKAAGGKKSGADFERKKKRVRPRNPHP